MDGMEAQRSVNRGSIRSATSVGTILQDLALLLRTKHIYASIGRIKGADNTMSDDASRLTHLPNWMFLHHFALAFPQKKPWRLLTLLSRCRWQLTSMLHIKCCRMYYQPLCNKRTLLLGANTANSANGWSSHTTSIVLGTFYLSSRYLPSACAPAFWQT